MTDLANLFERQARWQESLRELSWPDKIRMAAAMRASMMALRKSAPAAPKRVRLLWPNPASWLWRAIRRRISLLRVR